MENIFINRSEASAYLHGKWKTAIIIQFLCISTELLLITAEWIIFYRFPVIPVFLFGLLLDLLLLSPLKIGRAFFYETLITDSKKAQITLFFHFFRRGYFRCVCWRIRLWLLRIGWYCLLTVPSALFLFISRAAEGSGEETLAMIAFIFSLVFLVIALTVTEILLFRYIPTLYLLTTGVSSHVFSLSRRISKGYTNMWTLLYLDYAGWALSFLFFFPFFYVSPLFHTARAATAKRLFLEISPQIHQQLLQHGKNHGRIRNEF